MKKPNPSHEVMKPYKGKQTMHQSKSAREERRWQKPLEYARHVMEDTAARVDASRRLFPYRFLRGDCHAHTQHSDGIGTVAEMAEMVRAAGLDFQYITDHWGLTQTPECKQHGLWVGQEPGTEYHHLGILGLRSTFEPERNLLADYARVKQMKGVPFIPHPAGWWPRKVYTAAQRQALFTLPAPFLMEIINGANMIGKAFDYTDEAAVEVWDELLTAGRQVHAMGNTDSHSPHGIGTVWNGVWASRCDEATILKRLQAGRMFVSEGPLLHLTVGSTGMGSRVKDRRQAGPVKLTVVDSRGLLRVRLVADGRVRRTWHMDGEPVMKQSLTLPRYARTYIRIEAIAIDGKRGYTNPVYLGRP